MAFRSPRRRGLDGAVLGPRAFVLRFFAQGDHDHSDDRLLLVNLGAQLDLTIMPEPLLAPPVGRRWGVIWSSDDPLYGGPGVGPVVQACGWRLQAESACVMAPLLTRSSR
jgi:maltooligosyltrehalose trehalohydrolase